MVSTPVIASAYNLFSIFDSIVTARSTWFAGAKLRLDSAGHRIILEQAKNLLHLLNLGV